MQVEDRSERGSEKKRREGKERGPETDTPRYTLPPLPSSVLFRSFMTAEMRASSVFWNAAPASLDLRMELYFCRSKRGTGTLYRSQHQGCESTAQDRRNTSSDAAPALLDPVQDNPRGFRDDTSKRGPE